MKLKKIASLMLAGIMAVSMLAGCKGNAQENPGEQEQPVVDTTIAGYLNDAQNANSLVKIDFTYDGAMENTMRNVAENFGDKVNAGNFENAITTDLGKIERANVLGSFYGYKSTGTDNTVNSKEGTQVFYKVYDKNVGMPLDKVAEEIMNDCNGLSNLVVEATVGKIDYTYEYAGKVAMVKADSNNDSKYYVAVVITCTTAGELA